MARIGTGYDGDAERIASAPGDPLILLRNVHAAKLALCDRLEAIADRLPADVSGSECEAAARTVVPLLENAHRFEEGVVFPLCERLSPGSLAVAGSLDRLAGEHREDASYGEEVAEALLQVGDARPMPGAEALGFMLRGFFGSLRRHIAFEQDFVAMIAETARLGGR
ncbi:hemerythrin domain-containing protein [Mesorhizobium sp. L-8-3]|uniref:hemerythrin domain-containing protein n=1 Tax=Mesorhizobium sp. L-8-3 TaxID=2744522 RepID=UPI0019363503|nr:hemerythrin domain-containing protein [Mesorhizobium sp. L-8-3]BCH25289.1 hypothetical protein MesoLjLb_50740 [Mesorhizobium sp. L-8-3]